MFFLLTDIIIKKLFALIPFKDEYSHIVVHIVHNLYICHSPKVICRIQK